MPVVVHKSRVDTWIAVLLLFSPGLILVLAVLSMIEGDTMQAGITLGLLGFILILFFLFVFPMRYELNDEALVVRLGLLRLRFPYDRIREVYRTRNPLSGYALSLHRLQVIYRTPRGRQTFILISPRSRMQFLEDLEDRSPAHGLLDDRLVRRRTAAEDAGQAAAMAGE